MKPVKVGAAVLNQTPMDWEGNRDRILQAVDEARSRGVSLLALPELCVSGYGCEDMFHAAGTTAASLEMLEEILPATAGMIVTLGLPMRYRKTLFNAVCLAVDGQAAGFAAKQHLAGGGIHYEPRWFKPWPEGRRADLSFGGGVVPFGDAFFDCGGVKIGFEICEDAWAAGRPGKKLSAMGADIIVNPSASHFAFGKQEVRKQLVSEGSRAFGVVYLYANLLGNESGRAVYDGGALIAAHGELIAAGPRFSYRDVGLTTAVVDVDAVTMERVRNPGFRARLGEEGPGWIAVPCRWPSREPEAPPTLRGGWEEGPRLKEEEFSRAVSLALFDYLRKSRSRGFVVSLSGGADSSAVACLVFLMVKLGTGELGREVFCRKIGVSVKDDEADINGIVGELLACVYQSTRNSGRESRVAAEELARALGADFLVFDVDSLVQDYTTMVSEQAGRALSWEEDDLALQNIQARVRGPGAWLLANLRESILLATSNRSEAAVGYATMDGDTCGGLSPVGGIDKAFLREWLKWLESEGPGGSAPVPALAGVNALEPSAELRPGHAGQTDESDLMPYTVLDAIEGAAIGDKLSPVEVYRVIGPRFPAVPRDRLGLWVERFFRLWVRNQWKRERYAPSFHLDDTNLDPKTWCRFPILSGGYEKELDALRNYLEDREREEGEG